MSHIHYPLHANTLRLYYIHQLQEKMLDVQQQLQDVKQQLDELLKATNTGIQAAEYQLLQGRLEQLKEEFRDLLAELRRQKAAEGATLLSDDVSMFL